VRGRELTEGMKVVAGTVSKNAETSTSNSPFGGGQQQQGGPRRDGLLIGVTPPPAPFPWGGPRFPGPPVGPPRGSSPRRRRFGRAAPPLHHRENKNRS